MNRQDITYNNDGSVKDVSGKFVSETIEIIDKNGKTLYRKNGSTTYSDFRKQLRRKTNA